MDGSKVILFDGICNLCNSAVNFVIKRDKKDRIKFTTLQSDTGKSLLSEYHLPVDDMRSFVFIENGKAYIRSTASLRLCRYLSGLWPLCYGAIIIPRFLRDGIYNLIANRRYKWFGTRKECMVPTPELRAKFLD